MRGSTWTYSWNHRNPISLKELEKGIETVTDCHTAQVMDKDSDIVVKMPRLVKLAPGKPPRV
jgi:hypothetical protein